MMRIDAHQHYWNIGNAYPLDRGPWHLGTHTYGWEQAGLPQLNRSYLPNILEPILQRVGVDATIVVQVLNNWDETAWLLDLASSTPSIAGVVGWVDLDRPRELIEGDLTTLIALGVKLVGIRHLLQFE